MVKPIFYCRPTEIRPLCVIAISIWHCCWNRVTCDSVQCQCFIHSCKHFSNIDCKMNKCFYPYFSVCSNQNFLISILISVCMCLGPHWLGLFYSSLADTKNVINISMLFTQEIRHFLSWAACTLNKAKVVGDLGSCENWRWTSVGIAETGRKFEWQEFCITHVIFICIIAMPGIKANWKKSPTKQTPANFLPDFIPYVLVWRKTQEWNTRMDQEWKVCSFLYLLYILISLTNILCLQENKWGAKTGRVRKWQGIFLIKHLSRSRLLLWCLGDTDAVDQTDGWYQERSRKE